MLRKDEMSKVRWGILSTARIGMLKVIPGIQRAENCQVMAIASRSAQAAEIAANELGIPTAYGSYEELLAADDIDALYIPLPNDMHAEWVVRAAEAGKHILCEKPLAMSVSQAEEMATACRNAGVNLQEAFMYRHHPQWVEAVRLVNDGQIGGLVSVQSWFSYYNDDPANIRNRAENGGGAVMDIGCYSINLARMLFGAEPVRIESVSRRDPAMGIEVTSSVVLDFPDGGQSMFTCSMRAANDQGVRIVGTTGRIEIEIPFNAPPDRETKISVTTGGGPHGLEQTETVVFPAADQYTIQAELFARSVLDDTQVPVPITDAIENMRVIEAILAGEPLS